METVPVVNSGNEYDEKRIERASKEIEIIKEKLLRGDKPEPIEITWDNLLPIVDELVNHVENVLTVNPNISESQIMQQLNKINNYYSQPLSEEQLSILFKEIISLLPIHHTGRLMTGILFPNLKPKTKREQDYEKGYQNFKKIWLSYQKKYKKTNEEMRKIALDDNKDNEEISEDELLKWCNRIIDEVESDWNLTDSDDSEDVWGNESSQVELNPKTPERASPDIEEVKTILFLLSVNRATDEDSRKQIGWILYKTLGNSGSPMFIDWVETSTNYSREFVEKKVAELWPTFQNGYLTDSEGNELTLLDYSYFKRWIKKDNKDPNRMWTVSQLLSTEFPEPKWAIPELIPEGLTILGGRPKVGKSWFMLQAAISVSMGGVFLDKKVDQGRVLYIALEDSPKRMKNRIRKLNIPEQARIDFRYRGNPLNEDSGYKELVNQVKSRKYKLIIIDTLSRAFPGLSQDKNPEKIGKALGDIQSLALDNQIAIVFLDHTRKSSGQYQDPIDDIMSTTKKTGVADVILALYKEQGKTGSSLKGRGRDIEEIDLNLYWDSQTCCWQINTNQTERKDEIIEALLKLGGKHKASDVAKFLEQDRSNTYKRLEALYNDGKIQKDIIDNTSYFFIEDVWGSLKK